MMKSHTGHAAHNDENNADGNGHKPSKSSGLLIAGGVANAALIVAPYVGDALGVSAVTVPDIMHGLHGHGLGTGLAGGINSLLNMVPLVGETLSAGGMTPTITSGIIGIGGILLGNYLAKKHHKHIDAKWVKVIKYAALTTSILIALPSILTGISVGLAYLASFAGAGASASALSALSATIGSIGGTSMATAGAGIGSALTHLITCGGAALSVAGSIYLDKNSEPAPEKKEKTKVEIVESPELKRGQQCQIKIRITDENGKVLTPDDLTETYTKKLHVMLVDSALIDYQHIHPEFDKDSGLFVLDCTPKCHGEYALWSEFNLKKNNSHSVIKNQLIAEQAHKMSAVIQHTNNVDTENVNVVIECNPPLTAGKESSVKIKINNKPGAPVQFQEVMGAPAHLVGFSKDGENLIHCHPTNEKQSDNGELNFHIEPEKAGFNKFFLQIKTNDKESMIPFGQYIQPHAQFVERETAPQDFTKQQNSAMVQRSNHMHI